MTGNSVAHSLTSENWIVGRDSSEIPDIIFCIRFKLILSTLSTPVVTEYGSKTKYLFWMECEENAHTGIVLFNEWYFQYLYITV